MSPGKSFVQKGVTVNGTKIVYFEAGPLKAPRILMVHGFRGNHRGLFFLGGILKKKYRVIIPDLPGYGSSAPMKEEHNFASYSKFLSAFAKKLSLDPYILLGHSFGASLCIPFAAKYPRGIAKLILISPVISSKGPIAKIVEYYYKGAKYLSDDLRHKYLANRLLAYLTAQVLTKAASPERKRYLIEEEFRNLEEVNDHVVMESLLGFYKVEFITSAKKIKLNTLIIGGVLDGLAPMADMVALHKVIKGSELEFIEKTGHFSVLELEDDTAKPILKFLA